MPNYLFSENYALKSCIGGGVFRITLSGRSPDDRTPPSKEFHTPNPIGIWVVLYRKKSFGLQRNSSELLSLVDHINYHLIAAGLKNADLQVTDFGLS